MDKEDPHLSGNHIYPKKIFFSEQKTDESIFYINFAIFSQHFNWQIIKKKWIFYRIKVISGQMCDLENETIQNEIEFPLQHNRKWKSKRQL